MSQSPVRRGRPKGSGIDDQTRLEQIAALIAANQSLKPTTAIKQLGITDPSAIRRLRDKYQAFAGSIAVSFIPVEPAPAASLQRAKVIAARSAPVARKSRPVPKSSAAPAAATIVEALSPEPASSEPPASIQNDTAPAPGQAAASDAATRRPSISMMEGGLFDMWCAFGLRTLASVVEAQMALANQLMRSPLASQAMHNQIAINNVAMELIASTARRPAN